MSIFITALKVVGYSRRIGCGARTSVVLPSWARRYQEEWRFYQAWSCFYQEAGADTKVGVSVIKIDPLLPRPQNPITRTLSTLARGLLSLPRHLRPCPLGSMK